MTVETEVTEVVSEAVEISIGGLLEILEIDLKVALTVARRDTSPEIAQNVSIDKLSTPAKRFQSRSGRISWRTRQRQIRRQGPL